MVVIDPLFGACEMGIACRVPPGIALLLVKPRAADDVGEDHGEMVVVGTAHPLNEIRRLLLRS